jgi:hypothetical protein
VLCGRIKGPRVPSQFRHASGLGEAEANRTRTFNARGRFRPHASRIDPPGMKSRSLIGQSLDLISEVTLPRLDRTKAVK